MLPLLPPGMEFSLLQNLTTALTDDDANYVIRFANSLFLQEGITFNPEFLHLMRKYFRAEVETVDFSESAAVAEQINTWVENHTESEWQWENMNPFLSAVSAYCKVTGLVAKGGASLFVWTHHLAQKLHHSSSCPQANEN